MNGGIDLEMEGNQLIKCAIKSCQYYGDGACTLESIQVSPCSNMTTGLPEDETMCHSYVKKK